MRERRANRGQLATSLVEATVGALLILSVVAGFLWLPAEPTQSEAALDRLAADTLAILDADPPAGEGRSRLTAACRSPSAFETERTALSERIDAALPPGAFGRIETPYGSAGSPQPTGVPAGQSTLSTPGCPVTLRVWYL